MALINPEIVGLARIKITIDYSGPTPTISSTYVFSNGFDAVSVEGAKDGASPIFVDLRGSNPGFVIFLTDAVQPGSTMNESGIKATFNVVQISTPLDPFPMVGLSPYTGAPRCQYGDYSLAGTLYANVDPQKALRFDFDGPFVDITEIFVDVAVFHNPVTLYK